MTQLKVKILIAVLSLLLVGLLWQLKATYDTPPEKETVIIKQQPAIDLNDPEQLEALLKKADEMRQKGLRQ